jgi:Fe-S-cluster containining protein
LKTGLKIHSDDFIAQYTVYTLDPHSGFPVISIRMAKDPELACPFVRSAGCSVYADRPMACRLFPLGVAMGEKQDGNSDIFFFELDISGCLGVNEERILSIEKWRDDQGLIPYMDMNKRMLDIVFHPARDRSASLSNAQLQKIIVAAYNLDVFREFIFKTNFFELYEIDNDTRSKVGNDDALLLELGFAYLKKTLFL